MVGKKTRLIFHLSYPRGSGKSVNENTPEELSKVKYKDFEMAVRLVLELGKNCALGKSDLSAAFRHFAIAKKFWCLLVMKERDPVTKRWKDFVDKCMPFGASISCA